MPDRPSSTPAFRPGFSRREALRALTGAGLALGAAEHFGSTSATAKAKKSSNVAAKAIYMDPRKTNDQDGARALADLIERTELNAIVLDIKEEGVYYRTDVDFYRENGALNPQYDVTNLLTMLRDRDIYVIGRLVVFKDPILAQARPNLAVKDTRSGDLWHDMNGVAWLNPFAEEVWRGAASLAREAARYGFDEIQYDYVRFPTDGDLTRMEFGRELTEESREDAILGLLELTQKKLKSTGATLGADIFGWSLVVDDDNGIGQNASRIAPVVDYFCPMVYPSHWPNGSLAVPGHPNDFPYQTVEISMELAEQRLPDMVQKVRPWLQGFSLPGMTPYGPEDIRAQIDAAEASGIEGWMIWTFDNHYPEDAFKPA